MALARRARPWLAAAAAAGLLAGPGHAETPAPGAAPAPGGRCEIPPAGARAQGQEPGSPAAAALERGDALLARGEAAAALAAYAESRRLALAEGLSELATLADAGAARAGLEAGERAGVAERLERARAAAEGLPPGPRGELLIHLGWSYALLARSDAAAGRRAAEVLASAGEAAAESGDARLRSWALGHLGELYEREGRLEEALVLTRRALFAAQEVRALEALARWQGQLGRLELAAGRSERALAALREAVALLGELRQQTAGAGALGAEVEPLYSAFVDLLLRRARESADTGQRQALLAEARAALEDSKAAELREYFRDDCLDARRKAAPEEIPGAFVVYPVVLPDRTELIAGSAGQLESFVSPVGREALAAEVHAFRRQLERRTTRQYLGHAQTLYDWLIRPLEPALAAAAPEVLVFVPDAALRTIPLGALRDRASGRFLIESYPLALAPGLTLIEPRPIERGSVRLLAAGITESVQGFPALANVGPELAAVGQTFPGQTLLNGEFAIGRFESEIAARPFGIVHIASHGEFSANSSESFLLAWDGKISMDRLAQVVAATQFRTDQPLELLTLSACQTATGDDRAGLGLAGVALRAGARSALATLWSVNDEASADLVTEFYAQLAQPELSRAEALQRAQLKLLATPDYRHPAYWAPFLLISSWL